MTGPAVSPRPKLPLRVFKDRAAAERAGLVVNPGTGICYERSLPAVYVAVGRLLTDLEKELASALGTVLAELESECTGLPDDSPHCAGRNTVRAALAAYREAAE